jgi:hypothetical protein
MDLATLLILGMLAAGLAIGAFFALIFLALLVYNVSHIYPWLRPIALWCAKLENLFALLVLAILLIVLIVFAYILLRSVLILLLIFIPILLFIPIDLGILVWVIKLVRWLYRQWRALFLRIYIAARLGIMGAQIKHDMGKGKDKDWTTHFADMKKKLSEEAEQARSRITRGK